MGGSFRARRPIRRIDSVVLDPRIAFVRDLISVGEGIRVEWKESYKAVRGQDLVAFANSEHGGTILVGVDDDGRAVGTQLTDEVKKDIGNKALGCIPPVELYLSQQLHQRLPIVRIDIPASHRRPHCTSGGRFTIRADGLRRGMTPGELLQMFVDREGQRFETRFQEATDAAIKRLVAATRELERRVVELQAIAGAATSSAELAAEAASHAAVEATRAAEAAEHLGHK